VAVVAVKALVAITTIVGIIIGVISSAITFYNDRQEVREPVSLIADPCVLITDTPATMGAGSSVD
jgi:hypothetical protein